MNNNLNGLVEGHIIWEFLSHNLYVVLTIVGSLIALGFAWMKYYRGDGYYKRKAKFNKTEE